MTMLHFSSLLRSPPYTTAADELFAALDLYNIKYNFISNTKDIWLRDFMPVKTKTGKYVSFRYEPSYLEAPEFRQTRTSFKRDIAPQFGCSVIYSEINLDGGNAVLSPSKETALISDRIFSENPALKITELVRQLERTLESRVIIIPSLKSDMTGHADGMVRFIDENTALCNRPAGNNTLETRIIDTLRRHGIDTVEFPYFSSPKDSAVGCYINYLETEKHIFLPVFDDARDNEAVNTARRVFSRTVVPVRVNKIAEKGGVLNCINWEN